MKLDKYLTTIFSDLRRASFERAEGCHTQESVLRFTQLPPVPDQQQGQEAQAQQQDPRTVTQKLHKPRFCGLRPKVPQVSTLAHRKNHCHVYGKGRNFSWILLNQTVRFLLTKIKNKYFKTVY